MARFQPMGPDVLSFEERHPTISDSGRRTLSGLLEASTAPLWNHQCGDRLDRAALSRVKDYATTVLVQPPRWRSGARPEWWSAYVEQVRQVVPRYRAMDAAAQTFVTDRADLAGHWWELVPDDADLDDLIWYPTTGSGHPPVVVPTHPVAVSSYYPLLLGAARWHDVRPNFRADRVDWLTVASNRGSAFIVPSWSSFLECATAKVNLDDSGWPDATARQQFLHRHDPQVITGDPVSLSQLADLDVELHPKVLISVAMHLNTATKHRLAQRFGCPVVDVYSTTESGPIAASRPGDGMGLLQPQLFVEITDGDNNTCAPDTLGMITLTGGMNPYLPLLRYRTGDSARMVWSGDEPILRDLTGRRTVLLVRADGGQANSFDISKLFEQLPLRRWSVHQYADASVRVRRELEHTGPDQVDELIAEAIRSVVGQVSVTVEPLTAPDKVIPFTTEGHREPVG